MADAYGGRGTSQWPPQPQPQPRPPQMVAYLPMPVDHRLHQYRDEYRQAAPGAIPTPQTNNNKSIGHYTPMPHPPLQPNPRAAASFRPVETGEYPKRPPKKPKTAYNYFQRDIQVQFLQVDGKKFSHSQGAAKNIGLWWRKLYPHEKHKYEEMAREDRLRYNHELSLYLCNLKAKKRQRIHQNQNQNQNQKLAETSSSTSASFSAHQLTGALGANSANSAKTSNPSQTPANPSLNRQHSAPQPQPQPRPGIRNSGLLSRHTGEFLAPVTTTQQNQNQNQTASAAASATTSKISASIPPRAAAAAAAAAAAVAAAAASAELQNTPPIRSERLQRRHQMMTVIQKIPSSSNQNQEEAVGDYVKRYMRGGGGGGGVERVSTGAGTGGSTSIRTRTRTTRISNPGFASNKQRNNGSSKPAVRRKRKRFTDNHVSTTSCPDSGLRGVRAPEPEAAAAQEVAAAAVVSSANDDAAETRAAALAITALRQQAPPPSMKVLRMPISPNGRENTPHTRTESQQCRRESSVAGDTEMKRNDSASSNLSRSSATTASTSDTASKTTTIRVTNGITRNHSSQSVSEENGHVFRSPSMEFLKACLDVPAFH
eukprot:CAMPEP_0197532066 /NCGR_PEP_ID=MMETSP1318-20131121/38357_1 /TAXON_ID=552666 /ORGANISM="Partenskyella glossopodia, Strain RCC365" /LENGTH=597 /DNA_ID=CAMNT_0043088507 /DNA_START=70 /DNA_END=1863 /DNA_ORIENTATION=-